MSVNGRAASRHGWMIILFCKALMAHLGWEKNPPVLQKPVCGSKGVTQEAAKAQYCFYNGAITHMYQVWSNFQALLMKVMLFWVIPLSKKQAHGLIEILSQVNLFFQVYPGGMIKLTVSLELPWLVLRGEERSQISYQSLQRTLVTLATKHCSDQSEHGIHGLYPRAFCWSHLDMSLNKVYLCRAAVMKTDRIISPSGRFSQQLQLSWATDASVSCTDVELMLSELTVLAGGKQADGGINYIYKLTLNLRSGLCRGDKAAEASVAFCCSFYMGPTTKSSATVKARLNYWLFYRAEAKTCRSNGLMPWRGQRNVQTRCFLQFTLYR